jgi:hypothetical protein
MNIAKEIAALEQMTVKDLRAKYAEVFDETTNSGNKAWLIKRIAWRLQANAEGGLSERARQRAAELANESDLRRYPPILKHPATTVAVASPRAKDLPPSGTIITRPYKGRTLQVQVLDSGFEFEGEQYPSLSAIAKSVTGSHCSGRAFFGLGKEAKQ